MGCITVCATDIGSHLSSYITRVGDPLAVTTTQANNLLSASTERKSLPLSISANRRGAALNATCALICSTNYIKYLIVEPRHIWLMEQNGFEDMVIIKSNVTWKVT